MKTKIQILLIALAGLLPLAAQAQVNYAVSGDTAYVSNSPSASGDIVIASTYDDFPVTSIGDSAFFDCTSLTSVTIGTNVTSIGDDAFEYCDLTSVTIPDSVTSIGEGAFEYCTSLTNVTIGTNVTSIGDSAFYDCTSLTNVTIPDSVTSIRDSVFYDCASLTNVTIGTNVTSIGDDAFSGASLISITIPDSVTNIGDSAFGSCVRLTSVTIPDSVTSIGDSAFYGCASLTNVTIGSGVTSIGDSAFDFCASLASVTIGTNVTSIGDYAFGSCPALASVYFQGNAPAADSTIFLYDNLANIMVYYLPGTTGWDTFASDVGVVTTVAFLATTYGGLPVIIYSLADTNQTLQMSTNPPSGNWVTVSNTVPLTAVQLTNPPPQAFFRLQSSGGGAPDAGLAFYGNLPVLFYPTNDDDSLQMATNLAVANWSVPSGNAFITVQVTNAPPGAVFRLH